MKSVKIGVFGGTFNPVHIEHVNMVKAAMEALSLTTVVIMPTCLTPGKRGKIMASNEDRLQMCKLAFDKPYFRISDYEIQKGGVSYTYETLEAIKQKYPFCELYFIVGGDRLEDFHTWKNPDRILRTAKIAACAREDDEKFSFAVAKFQAAYGDRVVTFPYVGERVSSTRARVLAGCGESTDELLPQKVADYIKTNGVYYRKLWSDVKPLLKPERWQHTLRVAFMVAENCQRIGWPEKDAVTAAILHDGAKYLTLDSPYLKGFKPPKDVPKSVMHQYTGAYLANNFFGVKDEKIVRAIRYHCSGRANMTPEEVLLYLCDMLEEGRDFPGVQELREVFYEDLDRCMYECLKHQMAYLQGEKDIYPETNNAYEYYRQKYEIEGNL